MIGKQYCKCPVCGSDCEVDTSMILTSYPPQYQAFCKNCNRVIYTLCSNTYGKISINPEDNTIIKKDVVDYHNDIRRIADALEKLAKYFTEDHIIGVKEMTDEEREKYLKDLKPNTAPTKTTPITISPYITVSNMCEDCWWYQHLKNNPNPTITVGDTPCTWCSKRQPTCTCTSEVK